MDSPNETGASATASSSVMMFEDSTANGIKEVKDTLDSQEVKGILDSLEAKTAKQLCELVEHYAIPDTDMKTDAARRERIRFHLTNRQTSTKSVAELLQDVWKDTEWFKNACQELHTIGGEMLSLVSEKVFANARLKERLTADLQDLEQNMEHWLKNLKEGQCRIVVTGEASVGKSSFLNLIFEGSDISLPQSQSETTACICEIKHGDPRRMVFHRNKPRKGEPPSFTITPGTADDLKEHASFENFQQGRLDALPIKKVEIFVPLEFLKGGLVLVDTPGIESEAPLLERFVDEYLHNCVGFIYVLHDSVNVHRLCSLFQIERNSATQYACEDDEVEELTSSRMTRNSLFLLNKWDTAEDPEKFMSDTTTKLERHWLRVRGVNRESSILKLAATVDRLHFQAGYVSDRLQGVVDSLKKVVPDNMKFQLRRHYRMLQLVCSRIERHCQRYLYHSELDSEDLEQVQQDAKQRLDKLTDGAKDKIREFELYRDNLDLSDACTALAEHLNRSDVRRRILSWSKEDCPEGETYAILEKQAKRKVEKRVRDEIEKWENEHHMLATQRKVVVLRLRSTLRKIDVDVEAIDEVLKPIDPVQINAPGFTFGFLHRKYNVFNKVMELFLFEIFDIFDKRRKSKVDHYSVEAMEEMAENTLSNLAKPTHLNNLLGNAMGLDQLVTSCKQQIDEATRNASKEVRDLESKETAEYVSIYKPIRLKCLDIHRNLLQWELKNLFKGDQIESDDIQITGTLLGSGVMTGYFLGKRTVGSKSSSVTVKRYAKKTELCDIVRDYHLLRTVSSDFVAKASGMVQLMNHTELVVIMEPSLYSLDCLLGNERHLGGYMLDKDKSRFDPVQIGSDVANGLSVLHEKGYVHGDLTLSTVMVTKTDVRSKSSSDIKSIPRFRVKLYHFGVLKGSVLPIGDRVPVAPSKYWAPERIWRRCRCYPAMDVYSLGQILSDLWYGSDKYKAFTAKYLPENPTQSVPVEDAFSGKLEPEVFQKPPKSYEDLIRDCCATHPGKRPVITTVIGKLGNVYKDVEET